MNDLIISSTLTIPSHELIITTSRSGGPGGQHVNKSDTKITIHWNVRQSEALSDEQRILLLKNLQNRLTYDRDLVVVNSESRSQLQNKENALKQLAAIIIKALIIPKKRMKVRISKAEKLKRREHKMRQSALKKARSGKFEE